MTLLSVSEDKLAMAWLQIKKKVRSGWIKLGICWLVLAGMQAHKCGSITSTLVETSALFSAWALADSMFPINTMILTHCAFIFSLFSLGYPVGTQNIWSRLIFIVAKGCIYLGWLSELIGQCCVSSFILESTSDKSKETRYKLASRLNLLKSLNRFFPFMLVSVPSGIIFFLEEYSLFSAAPFLLKETAGLIRNGNNGYKSLQNKNRPKNVIVLIHGNRFNECQYLLGKEMLQGASKSKKFIDESVVLTVNYFGGECMRDHTDQTTTIESCANLVISQVKEQLIKLKLDEKKLKFALVGHSLGAVLSCYIQQNMAVDANWQVSKVIAISGPLSGSAALKFMQKNLKSKYDESMKTCPVFVDLLEDSPKIKALWKALELNNEVYEFFCGSMDFFVGPSAALPHFVPAEHKHEYYHLGHHNIKLSWLLWVDVIDALEAGFQCS